MLPTPATSVRCFTPAPAGLVERPEQVRRVAARRQAERDVAWPAEGGYLPGEYDVDADIVRQRGHHRRVAGQAQGRKRQRVAARVQELRRALLRVRSAPAVPERQQAASGREPRGGLSGAGGERVAAAGADLGPQFHRLLRLGDRRCPCLRQQRGQVGGAGVQERVERLHRPRLAGLAGLPRLAGLPGQRGLRELAGFARLTGLPAPAGLPWRAALLGHAGLRRLDGRRAADVIRGFRYPRHLATTPIASRACTRMVSPIPAVTSATLTSSSPFPVSTTARSSSSRRTTVTATAVSEQVMQASETHSDWSAARCGIGWPAARSGPGWWAGRRSGLPAVMTRPPAPAHPAARRRRAPVPRARGTW